MGLLAAVLLLPAIALAAPANPRFAWATAPRSNEVLINWEPITPTAGTDAQVRYHIWRATSASGTYTQIGSTTGRYAISYLDTGTVSAPLLYKTRYWYRLEAEDASGRSGTPVYMTGTPSGITAENLMSPTTGGPLEPRSLTATATVNGSDVEKIRLTWSPVSGSNVARYGVWRLTQSGSTGTYVGSTTNTSTPYFDDTWTGLEVEEYYWYRVAAVSQVGSTFTTGPLSFEMYIRPMSNEDIPAPHSGGSATGNSCGRCHQAHCAAADKLLKLDAGSDQGFCLSCHDGTGSRYDIAFDFADTNVGSRHPVDAGGFTGGDLICGDCHTPHADPYAEGSYKLLRSHEQTGTIEYCLVCHKPDTPDDSTYTERTENMTPFRDSAHNQGTVADPPSGTGIKCRTCHLPHSSPNEDLLMYAGYRACFNCHSSSKSAGLTSPDIYALMTANDNIDAHHDVLKRDQDKPGAGRMACQNCHNSHAATDATPLIDPYDPAPWNPYPKTVNPAFASITNHWENSFCFECHDNSLPTSEDTTPWVPAPVWSDPLGNGNTTSDFDDITARWANQRHGKASTAGENVWPEVTAAFGANPELRCLDCHEAHGTVGVRNLRSDIMGHDGLLILNRPEVTGGIGYDSRFWCMGCHKEAGATHTSGGKSWATFPKDCTNNGSCHGHQNGGGQF